MFHPRMMTRAVEKSLQHHCPDAGSLFRQRPITANAKSNNLLDASFFFGLQYGPDIRA